MPAPVAIRAASSLVYMPPVPTPAPPALPTITPSRSDSRLTSAPQAAAALEGQGVGTTFHPTGRRRPTRLLWLAHASNTKGGVHLDAGAVRALTTRKASLLPAGITGVTGTFVAGDPIDLIGPDDVVIARGIVNYDSAELPALLGRSTRDLAAELGAEYEREVVHRDDMMVI